MRPDLPHHERPSASLPGPLVLLALLVLAAHAWTFRDFLVDDAYISWRYARHIAEGLGPVFNAGERVEGYSNPLYTFLLSIPARWAPGDDILPIIGRLTGLLAALGTLIVMARWPGLAGGVGPALALLLTATSSSLALWSVGGLETTLYGFLIAAALGGTLARPDSTGGRIGTGLLLAGVALSRPEGIVPAGALYLVRWLDPATRRQQRGHLLVGLAFVLPIVAYLVFRVSYFGDWLPNTWYAKKVGLVEAWRKGSWYLVSFVHHNGGKWLYAAAPLALFDRARRPLVLSAAFVLAAYLPYVLFVGGDWMDQHRFLAPVVPLIYLLTGLGWGVIIDNVRRQLMRWPGGDLIRIVSPLGTLAVWLLLVRPTIDLTRDQIDRGGYVNASPYYETVGREIALLSDPDWSVATHDIGAIGWYGRTRVVDLLGLVDHDLARGRMTGDELIRKNRPELVVLHYDNREAARMSGSRWRGLESTGLDSIYHEPGGDRASFPYMRVRSDRQAVVLDRLVTAGFGASERDASAAVNRNRLLREWLETHQPDGFPFP